LLIMELLGHSGWRILSMSNKKTLDIIKDLKKNIIFSTRPPKDNEGANESIWIDTTTNTIYIKYNNTWTQQKQPITINNIDCGEYS